MRTEWQPPKQESSSDEESDNELEEDVDLARYNQLLGALDSQPQVIKFTSCLPMVGYSLQLLPPLTGHDIAEILLKVALNTKNHIPFFVIYKARHEPTPYW
jgi:hypothetical protein